MAARVTGRLSLRRAKPPWLAGSSYSLIVGAPLARSMAALMMCLDHTAIHGACAQPAYSPNSMRGSCPGATSLAGGEKPGHGKDRCFPT